MTSPPPPPPPSPSLLRHLIAIDTAISSTLYNLTQPILPRPFLKLLEISGDGRLFFPIIIAAIISPIPSSSPIILNILINLLIGALFDLIIIGTIKHLVRRPRPVYNKHMFISFAVDHWSFPSGHSSRVCFISAFIYLSSDLLEFSDVFMLNKLNVIVIGWASATSVSRVLLGRHFVFDVVAGACIGVANAVFVFSYFNCDLFRNIMKKELL